MRLAYYPGCSLESTGVEYDISTRLVAKHLGLELWEIPDWNCCGASAAHSTNHLLALALPARNLALAEKEGLDVAVPCAACFSRLKFSEAAVRSSATMREKISSIIEMPYEGRSRARALVDIICNDIAEPDLREKVVKPLSGLNIACYYGCLLLRPPWITRFDDPEDPQSLDQLVARLGGQPVDWPYKTECCGAGHTTTKPIVAASLLRDIYRRAKEAGADCLVCACPLCFLNLDMRQAEVERANREEYSLPVFYFTELIGVALGYPPKEVGLNRHVVNPLPLLVAKEILRHPASRRDEA